MRAGEEITVAITVRSPSAGLQRLLVRFATSKGVAYAASWNRSATGPGAPRTSTSFFRNGAASG